MTPRQLALSLMAERKDYPTGSPDWDWRTRAAWKLYQLSQGIPARDWTDTPPTENRKAA